MPQNRAGCARLNQSDARSGFSECKTRSSKIKGFDMEIFIGLVVLFFVWQVVKSMGRARKLINDINTVRMNALRNPDRYTQGFHKYDDPSEIKKSIATTLYMGLTQLGHNVSDYIPGNIEAMNAFDEAVDEIYDLIKRS